MHAVRIWDFAFSLLSRLKTKMSLAFHSARHRPSETKALRGVVWPCPLPFPEMHRKRSNRGQVDAARKLAINFTIIALNMFHNGSKHFASAVPAIGTRLNLEQWAFVKSLRPLVDEWNQHAPVTPEAMGRAAAKFENVEELLHHLQEESFPIATELRSYLGRLSSGLQTSWGHVGSPGRVVGSSSFKKALQPGRLRFWEVPTFNAMPYLDNGNQETFENPLDHALNPDVEEHRPRRVRMRIREKDKMEFLELLDKSDRLALVPEHLVRAGYENGAFAVPKDQDRDRMVLDARAPNILEQSERRWIRSLGSVSQFNHFFVAEGHQLRLYAEDLREFYHAFLISKQRIIRNAYLMKIEKQQVRHLKAFTPDLEGYRSLVPCLKTLAMGDTNAVAYGQAAHLGVLLQKTSLRLRDFVTLKQRPDLKKGWTAGLMIDDFILLESFDPEADRSDTCSKILEEVHKAYEEVKLPRHTGKSVKGEEKGSFWGVELNGKEARFRPLLARAIPLAQLIMEVVALGQASVGLLEVISGCLVSIFQLRRRFMSALQEVYMELRETDGGVM